MILTHKQEDGLSCAAARYKAQKAYTCIGGYAGSGKSTLVSHIVSGLGLLPEEVGYVAYTGKAANVLRQKGCPNAMTAHKLLYETRPKSDGTFIHMPRETLDKDYKLLVVDEVSMLPRELWELLISHRIHVLACGDPGQLPPIYPDDDNHVLDRPHVFLDEIMRQAQESEIIRLSMHLREGRPAATFQAQNKDVMILSPHEVNEGVYKWADQILCATNAKRNAINVLSRDLKDFGMAPELDDKVIGLRNHWDVFSCQGNALTNGAIGQFTDFYRTAIPMPRYSGMRSYEVIMGDLLMEDGDMFRNLCIDYNHLTTGKSLITPELAYKLSKDKKFTFPLPMEFDYGYAITTHKAQGSQWNRVLVFEEGFPQSREEHSRWMYTAVTRAADKLVVVKR